MRSRRTTFAPYLMLLAAMAVGPSAATAGHYQSLEGLAGVEAVYDFRLDHPAKAALFLKLIHGAFGDDSITRLAEAPEFVVVFSGAAVKLIAEEQGGYSPEDQAYLREIADRIASMAADGIKMEGCLGAAELFGVDPDLFLSEIGKIGNAWISITGYQAHGFSVIPVF